MAKAHQEGTLPADFDGLTLAGHRANARDRGEGLVVVLGRCPRRRRAPTVSGHELCWCAGGDHQPAAKHDEPVTQTLRLVHEVGDQDDRRAHSAHLLHQRPRLAACGRVQTGRHLVEEDQLGAIDQSQRDEQPLPLPTGQARKARAGAMSQSPVAQHRSHVAVRRTKRGEESDRFLDPHACGQCRVLQLAAHEPPHRGQLRSRIKTEDRDITGIRAPEPLEALHGGGLARPVGSEDPDDLSPRDLQRNIPDRDHVAIRFDQRTY